MCRKELKSSVKKLQEVEEATGEEEDENEDETAWYEEFFPKESKCNALTIEEKGVSVNAIQPQYLKVRVDNHILKMEVDGGAGISLISEKDYAKFFEKNKLIESDLKINYYGGEQRQPKGLLKNVEIEFRKIKTTGNLYVMGKSGEPLLGRDWLTKLGLWPLGIVQSEEKLKNKVNTVNNVRNEKQIEILRTKFLNKNADLFTPGLGTFNKDTFKVQLKEGTKPVYLKPRSVPFALKEKITAELDRLVQENVLTPVEVSDWGTPIVPVPKPDGTVRLCGDYKVTLNPSIEVVRYPIPRIEHLIAEAQGGEIFSKIDLREAYAQVPLDEESQKLLTLSTHKGLYRPKKLMYGIASAPGYFQKIMEQILVKIKNVTVFLDDIYIKSKTVEENLKTLEMVFEKLRECGLKLKKEKCLLLQDRIRYLGVEIDKNGVRTIKERIEAIEKIPEPKNVKELQAFLGTINYWGNFIEDRATKFSALYECLNKNNFAWTEECKQAFARAKLSLKSSKVLMNYDPKKPLILTCDASDKGLSAVLAHETKEGERPIAYASKTLSKSEKHYSIIDKEAKAIVFGITRFYDYVYGREFLLRTDHEPLVRIFGPKKGIPIMAARRLQRYADFLSAFRYKIAYIKSADNCADGLSRLPVPEINDETKDDEYTYLHYVTNETAACLDSKIVARESRKDIILAKVVRYVRDGWPMKN